MAEYVYKRENSDFAVVVLRVPKALWDRWEYRHRHFGKAVHSLRESCIEIMAQGSMSQPYSDVPDPFYRED